MNRIGYADSAERYERAAVRRGELEMSGAVGGGREGEDEDGVRLTPVDQGSAPERNSRFGPSAFHHDFDVDEDDDCVSQRSEWQVYCRTINTLLKCMDRLVDGMHGSIDGWNAWIDRSNS